MVKKTMKFLANDILYLLNGINAEKTDLVYLSIFSVGLQFYWQEDEQTIYHIIRKKSGIIPSSLNGKIYRIDLYPLMGIEKLISNRTIEFNSDDNFLVDIDFESQKKNQVVLCVTDTEIGSRRTINVKEVFNIPGLPDPRVKAYANNHDCKTHLRLAKYVAETGCGEVFMEFGNRMKISAASKEIFMGGVIMDYAYHDDFWMPDLKIGASAVSHILSFKDSSVCWAETEPGILMFIGDDGAVSTPYRESSEGTERQHLISNDDRDGWVNVDRNLLIKQLEGVCSPTVLTESSAIMPIKSISQLEDGDILVETDNYKVKATASVANQIIQGIALLEFWGFPQKDSFYNNIIELVLKEGNLHIVGYDGRKKKINLRSNPSATGYWRGDGKKLIKILALLSEYDNKIQVFLDHPRLQITTASGASILMLGCDLVDPDEVGENQTKLNYSEKPILVFPDIEDEHSLDINELFTQKVLQLYQLREIVQRVDAWVDNIDADPEQMEKICSLIDKVNVLIDFIPEGFDIPSLDECFDGDYYSYGHIKIQSNDPEEFLRQIDSLFCGLSEGVGKVMQCYCELPILMQYTF